MRLLLMGTVTLLATAQVRPLLERCNLERATARRFALPGRLTEVSGLAFSSTGQLLAHNDEQGRVFVVDTASGGITAEFAMGPEIPTEDFEGIEDIAGRLFLVTSAGRLYETRVVASGRVIYKRLDTDLGRLCEVEGLGAEPAAGVLLLACKEPRNDSLENRVAIFRWDVNARAPADPARIIFDERALQRGDRDDRFRTSGIARDPATGNYILIAGPDRAIAEVTAQGRVIAVARLRGHPQPEGVAVGADGRLWIADEGGNDAGRLAMYACR